MADDPPINEVADAAASVSAASPFATLEPSLEAMPASPGAGDTETSPNSRLDLVFDVPVCLSVELGRTEVPIRDVVHLGRGSIIELDRGPGAPLDVRVNGVLVGRGEVVLINAEKLGLRFVEVVSQAERVKRLS
ncbi:MAG TPA: flagellar motor switch protein FliN [Stellaceae bacterium]|nr:flagellar motor switch protein FliN [Stellaceae bacterium]